MLTNTNCVVCDRQLPMRPFGDNLPLCDSLRCESTIRSHLRGGKRCCCGCGMLVQNSPSRSPPLTVCSKYKCLHLAAQLRGTNAVFCRICGIYLNKQEFGDTKPVCRSRFCARMAESEDHIAAENVRAERYEQRRTQLVELLHEQSTELQSTSSSAGPHKIIVLPNNPRKLEPPNDERLRNFEARLLGLATKAIAMNDAAALRALAELSDVECYEPISTSMDEQSTDIQLRDEIFASQNGVACGTCGGSCCRAGGDEAFLRAYKFAEVLLANPGMSVQEIVAEYMSCIPLETYRGSCIFHGLNGCGLSRERRSIVCNTFLCNGLLELKKSINSGESQFLMASTNVTDENDSEPKVFRIRFSRSHSEQSSDG